MKVFCTIEKTARFVFRGVEIFLMVCLLYLVIATSYYKQSLSLNNFEDAFIYSLFWWTDKTIWAPGFTEEKFQTVIAGMKEEDVIRIKIQRQSAFSAPA